MILLLPTTLPTYGRELVFDVQLQGITTKFHEGFDGREPPLCTFVSFVVQDLALPKLPRFDKKKTIA